MSESRFRVRFPESKKRRAIRKNNPNVEHFIDNLDIHKFEKFKKKKKK